ncbi:hypothetical protein [Actinophytocola gossypii]|uniref:Uncharacterized protein n=1 Tax=Actinophytocola gossypii TaxID=2812003 RepID=A0ABT2J8V1_9PSEU|nr:hypothetical protein [Actinophytocola gossypii]MCT2584288.1 hypothetical protein [Actinophytocola gossypii]
MLLGGNNRLIGAAHAGAPTLSAAVLDAERARELVPAAAFTFHVAEDRQWYWRMHDEVRTAGPLAASTSGFARRLDAQRAARRFCRAAEGADIQLGLVAIPDRVRERYGPSRGA